MRKYNTDKRACHKQARLSYTLNNDTCNGDIYARAIKRTCSHTIYVTDTSATPPHIRIDRYIAMENMRRVFSKDTPQTHKPVAPYRKYIPQAPDPPHIRPAAPTPTLIMDIRRAKCILYDRTGTRIVYYDVFERAITYKPGTDTVTVTLYRNTRTLQVYPYLPPTDTVAGIPTGDLRKYGVEVYHI